MTMQFTKANDDFRTYMKRSGAVDVENDYDIRSEEASDYTHKEGYEKYVDYMVRSKAVDNHDGELLPTFNDQVNFLTKKDEKILKQKLKSAEENNNLMWEGVVSFRTDFLADQKIYDPNSGRVDQKTIKNALRDAMPKFLKQNNFGKNAFWWANIHLNTKHVHIHFSISEEGKSRRPTHNTEVKGVLKESSMRQLRGNVFRGLELSEERAFEIAQQQQVTEAKQKTIEEFRQKHGNELIEEALLNNAYRYLPLSPRVNSFKSNRQDFKKSKFYLQKYIDSQLANSSEFRRLKNLLSKEEKKYQKIYGITHQSYSTNQIGSIQKTIGNSLLRELYKLDKSDLKETTFDKIQKVDLKENEIALDILKRQLSREQDADRQRKLKYQISLRRIQIRRQRLQKKIEQAVIKQAALQDLNERFKDPLLNFKLQQIAEVKQLAELSLIPSYRLSESKRGIKKHLQLKQIDPAKISVTSRLLEEDQLYRSFNQKEQDLIKKAQLPYEAFEKIYPNQKTPQEAVNYLSEMLKLLDIKKEILNNNRKMVATKDFSLKKNNAILFKKLMLQLEAMNKEGNLDFKVKKKKLESPKALLQDPKYRKKVMRLHHTRIVNSSIAKPTLQRLTQFTQAGISNSSKRAIEQRERLDRAEERDEEKEI